jgi:hypothetical protein
MRQIPTCVFGAVALCALVAGLRPGAAADSKAPDAGAAVARGVAFIQKDALAWKAEKQCSTCHHGTMTLWALNEVKRQHYAVDSAALADVAQWTRERFLPNLDKPRDPRPGWSMISTPALFLAAMAHNQPELTTVSSQERKLIAGHVSRHLEEDGSVLTPATMTPPRPVNGPPPVFESREVLTLLAVLAMEPEEPADPAEASPIRDARKKSSAWLAANTPGDDTQAAALRLLLAVAEKRRQAIRDGISGLLARQNADGGWGQLRTLSSDAFATGQTLYILSLAGVDRKRSEIRRGVAFLVANQREDGSWPMTARAHPGATPMKNPSPIGHFGACWAVLGLARSVPAPKR